ncbi:hypothetical protein PXK56_17905 [Phaeobacter gallaeciensis]|uniref:hypothetical protein n=1 Tax=Phaeobacter gallaeciensis TaxID=60890 RepID=UPI0023808FB4|nr:hypothetical protein [Phaeobacter gallaeciensis]MDE4297064.1 hypothetical protein [Phaeobacter gallaeciensis]
MMGAIAAANYGRHGCDAPTAFQVELNSMIVFGLAVLPIVIIVWVVSRGIDID